MSRVVVLAAALLSAVFVGAARADATEFAAAAEQSFNAALSATETDTDRAATLFREAALAEVEGHLGAGGEAQRSDLGAGAEAAAVAAHRARA